MITVTTCSNPAEAMLLKSLLDANGINAYVPEELTAQSSVNFSAEGIRVQVDDENLATAQKILAEAETTETDDEESDEDASGENVPR